MTAVRIIGPQPRKDHPAMPESARQALHGLAEWALAALTSVPFLLALTAQLAYHLRDATQPGPPLWRRMLWAVPSAFVISQTALSLCILVEIPLEVAGGIAGVAGWYGLSGLHAMAVRILRARGMISDYEKEKGI